MPGKEETSLNLINTRDQEIEIRNFAIVNLFSFDGTPCNWPKILANFKSRAHFKQSFSLNMRLERLLNVLKRETKKLVESIGKSGIFYATALKTLKRDFGNTFTVAYMKTKLLFNKPQLKHNDQISLKDFPQQLKCHITWLKSMGYQSVLKSPEYLIKAVGRLPNCLGERFYKSARNIVNCEDFLSLE